MILVSRPDGHVAVGQAAHARMCGQMARAWGNDRFGVAPVEEVCLAAEQHDIGMAEWDLAPELDPATGLPATVKTMDLETHLALQIEGPRRISTQSRYAALLVSKKHCVMYDSPGPAGLLRRRNRQIRSYLDRSAAFQAELRASLDVSDSEIERDWRLVRTWDALSHNLLLDRSPCVRREVPEAGSGLVDLHLTRRAGEHTLDPWPFANRRLALRTEGRLLERSFTDRAQMQAGLARAPWIELAYELVPA